MYLEKGGQGSWKCELGRAVFRAEGQGPGLLLEQVQWGLMTGRALSQGATHLVSVLKRSACSIRSAEAREKWETGAMAVVRGRMELGWCMKMGVEFGIDFGDSTEGDRIRPGQPFAEDCWATIHAEGHPT